MKRSQTIMWGVLVTALMLGAGPAAADWIDQCQARIGLVSGDLDDIYAAGGIGGRNALRTYTSLDSKLSGASVKIVQFKFDDAAQKLGDFKDKVIQLRDAAKPKISGDDAELLLNGDFGTSIDEGVNGAIDCVCVLSDGQPEDVCGA